MINITWNVPSLVIMTIALVGIITLLFWGRVVAIGGYPFIFPPSYYRPTYHCRRISKSAISPNNKIPQIQSQIYSPTTHHGVKNVEKTHCVSAGNPIGVIHLNNPVILNSFMSASHSVFIIIQQLQACLQSRFSANKIYSSFKHQSKESTVIMDRARRPASTLWIMTLLATSIIATVNAATQNSALNNSPGAAIAFNPLIPVSDQLNIPVVAGAPPSTLVRTENEELNEDAYLQRLEDNRVQLEGSLYMELTPEDKKQMREFSKGGAEFGLFNFVRYSKEPLPWEGLEIDSQNIGEAFQDDDYAELGWSYSPWGGEFRYEGKADSAVENEDVDDEDDEGKADSAVENGDDGDEDDEGDEDKEDEDSLLVNHQENEDQPSKKQPIRHHHHHHRQPQESAKVDNRNTPLTDANIESSIKSDKPAVVGAKEEVTRKDSSMEKENSGKPKLKKARVMGQLSVDDPNVNENINEMVYNQIWDALDPPQKRRRHSQGYFEDQNARAVKVKSLKGDGSSADGVHGTKHVKRIEVEVNSDLDDEAVLPRLDQIDLLGHEAEVDWLNEQDMLQKEVQMKHCRQRGRRICGKDKDEDEEDDEYDDDDTKDNEEKKPDIMDEATRKLLKQQHKSPEEIFNDPLWHRKHGGLNPKHFHPDDEMLAEDRTDNIRSESIDRDEDGSIFPDEYSNEPYSKIVYPSIAEDPLSPLAYKAYNWQGDRVMDFSMVGWNEGNTDIPDPEKDVPIIERLSPRDGADSDSDQGDDTDRIQEALDRVSQITTQNTRGTDVVPKGALVLKRGVYRISKPLKIRNSGILFRGDPIGGSRIVCQWESTGPRYAIEIEGKSDNIRDDTNIPVVADYTPVGALYLALDPSYFEEVELAVGDQVILTRIGNDRWVEEIGMDDFDSRKKGVKPWRKMRGRMYRTIRSLDLKTGIVQLDAPLPISIWRRYGGAYVTKYDDNKIRATGIQFLDMVFPKNIGRTIDDMLDEKGRGSKDYRFSYEIFANYALRIDKACHIYITHVTSAYFHNFISLGTDVHHVTMDSIVHSYPDEMISGQSAFQLSGQLVLIQNSLSQGSFHFFVDINHVMGPNVFHRSQAVNVGKAYQPNTLDFAPGEVGPHMKFCTGILVDQVVTDGSIQIVNRGDMGTGQGYSGANSVVWNSRAREGILTHRSSGFQNFVIGSEDFEAEDRQPWDSHGWKEHSGSEVFPGSLYLRQLSDRLDRLSKGWVS